MSTHKKRTWCYALPPAAFEVAPCDCGNTAVQWSEYEGHLWCEKCQKDFVPAHAGVFDGPIPIKTAALLGVTFDRIDLATQKLQKLDLETGVYQLEAS